ncbi:MAG: carbohydrate ABC transporter permease [Hyphomicrobiaceae bacterium]
MSTKAFAYRSALERRALYALVIVLAALIMLPFVWLVIMSFKTNDDIFAFPPKLLFVPTLDNYIGLWGSSFRYSFLNSAVVSVTSTLLALIVGVPGGYALSRMAMRQDKALSLLILASRMAPPIAFTIPYFLAYRWLGLLDTKLGLILIYLTFNISLVVWLMRSFFDACPRSLEEAAWVDGASVWQGFTNIMLPICGPGVAATAILCFLYSWNDFFFALILTRNQAMTAPVAVVNFMNYEGWEWGKIAAGGAMVMLPVLIFSVLVRKFLVQGMTTGAIKG